MKNCYLFLMVFCLLTACKTKPPVQTPEDSIYTHEKFQVTVKHGWKAQKAEFSNALNIIKDGYILYINPNFVPKMDNPLEAVAKGAPGADFFWGNDFNTICTHTKINKLKGSLTRKSFFTLNPNSIPNANCKVPSDGQERWFFSYIYGGNGDEYQLKSTDFQDNVPPMDLAVTMTYTPTNNSIESFPTPTSKQLFQNYIKEMTEMVETIQF